MRRKSESGHPLGDPCYRMTHRPALPLGVRAGGFINTPFRSCLNLCSLSRFFVTLFSSELFHRCRPLRCLRISAFSFMKSLTILMFLLVPAPRLHAEGIVLSWDPSPSENVLGYRIYYGKIFRKYDESIDVGNTTHYTISQMPLGAHHFIVTAYNEFGESKPSNEVLKLLITAGKGRSEDTEPSAEDGVSDTGNVPSPVSDGAGGDAGGCALHPKPRRGGNWLDASEMMTGILLLFFFAVKKMLRPLQKYRFTLSAGKGTNFK